MRCLCNSLERELSLIFILVCMRCVSHCYTKRLNSFCRYLDMHIKWTDSEIGFVFVYSRNSHNPDAWRHLHKISVPYFLIYRFSIEFKIHLVKPKNFLDWSRINLLYFRKYTSFSNIYPHLHPLPYLCIHYLLYKLYRLTRQNEDTVQTRESFGKVNECTMSNGLLVITVKDCY